MAAEGGFGVNFDLSAVEITIFGKRSGGADVTFVIVEGELAEGEAGESGLDIGVHDGGEGGLGIVSVCDFFQIDGIIV